ncbi:MAG: YihY/virulence factor BrkB family protein, partial [Planctomycetales bacterium]|nr:YihY/virulence factor BrkB family protein [Planctomycetales bacterium]
MASALAFRTLFGLAPILVVTTILITNVKGPDVILDTVRDVLVAAGLDKLQVGAVPGNEELVGESVTLAQWLENLTRQLVNTDMSAVGLVGLAVIIYAAIGLMVTIENSFNIIYRAPDGRPWSRRVPLYWFILTISPIMIGLTTYVNRLFSTWIDSVPAWNVFLIAAKYAWGFALIWLLIVAVYALIPNSVVKLQPVCVGAFVATLLLWLGKNTFGAYLGNAFAINQLYGSLGLVPLFMFWVYLMWLAVLFGLEVSAILQMLRGRSLNEMDPQRAATE